MSSYAASSTFKVVPSSLILTILLPTCICPSFLLYIPNVLPTFLTHGPADASATSFFLGSSSFLISSAACFVALTIGWKRVCSSSPIATILDKTYWNWPKLTILMESPCPYIQCCFVDTSRSLLIDSTLIRGGVGDKNTYI